MAFWNRKKDPHTGRRREFEDLKVQARKAPLPTDRARLLNLAGDIALELDDDDAAMAVLGEALDVYLHDRDYRAARAIGRKLLRVRSSTVRVRSTLAWLAIAQDLPADARVALDLYVTSLQTDGDREFAVKHLRAMAEATDDPGLRESIAEHLESIGQPGEAGTIRARLAAEASGEKEPPSQADVRARWEEALARLVSPARK
jgi:hypothetical protein